MDMIGLLVGDRVIPLGCGDPDGGLKAACGDVVIAVSSGI